MILKQPNVFQTCFDCSSCFDFQASCTSWKSPNPLPAITSIYFIHSDYFPFLLLAEHHFPGLNFFHLLKTCLANQGSCNNISGLDPITVFHHCFTLAEDIFLPSFLQNGSLKSIELGQA